MRRKLLASLLAIVMVISMLPATVLAADFSDTNGHWGEAAIDRWADVGILNGKGDGNFDPNGSMTRAEFAQMLATMMGYTTRVANTFSDVPAGAWYEDAMLKLVAAGVLSGNGDGTATPNDPITREQAAVLLCRAFNLEPSRNASLNYQDSGSISSWARDAMAALAERGMMNGVGDNTAAPQLNINRASVATLADNMIAEYVTESKTITGRVDGIILVAGGASVNLDNATVSEPVIIAPKASGVSVNLTGSTTADDIVIEANSARVSVGANASASSVKAESNSASVSVAGTVSSVDVTGSNGKVTVTGSVGTVSTEAPGTSITVSGTVSNVDVGANASRASVTASAGGKIDSVTTDASNVTVSGSGSVGSVTATGGSVDVTTKGTEVSNKGASDVTASGSSVSSGNTATSTGSSSSGSSSGGSDDNDDSGYVGGSTPGGSAGNTGSSGSAKETPSMTKDDAAYSGGALTISKGASVVIKVTTDGALTVKLGEEAVATTKENTYVEVTVNSTEKTVTIKGKEPTVTETPVTVTISAAEGDEYAALEAVVIPVTVTAANQITGEVAVTVKGGETFYVNDPLPTITVTPAGLTVESTVWKPASGDALTGSTFTVGGTYTATITLKVDAGYELGDVTYKVDGVELASNKVEAEGDTVTLTVEGIEVSKKTPTIDPEAGPLTINANATKTFTVDTDGALTVKLGEETVDTTEANDYVEVTVNNTAKTVAIKGLQETSDLEPADPITVTIEAAETAAYEAKTFTITKIDVVGENDVISVDITIPTEIAVNGDLPEHPTAVSAEPTGSVDVSNVTIAWTPSAPLVAGETYEGTITVETTGDYVLIEATKYIINGGTPTTETLSDANKKTIVLSEQASFTAKNAITSVAVTLDDTGIKVGGSLPNPSVEVSYGDNPNQTGAGIVTADAAWTLDNQEVDSANKAGTYTATISVKLSDTTNHYMLASNVEYTVNGEAATATAAEAPAEGYVLSETVDVVVTKAPEPVGTVTVSKAEVDGDKLIVTAEKSGKSTSSVLYYYLVTTVPQEMSKWTDDTTKKKVDEELLVGVTGVKADADITLTRDDNGKFVVAVEYTAATTDADATAASTVVAVGSYKDPIAYDPDSSAGQGPSQGGDIKDLPVKVTKVTGPEEGVEVMVEATVTGQENSVLYYYLADKLIEFTDWTTETLKDTEEESGLLDGLDAVAMSNNPTTFKSEDIKDKEYTHIVVVEYTTGGTNNDKKVIAAHCASIVPVGPLGDFEATVSDDVLTVKGPDDVGGKTLYYYVVENNPVEAMNSWMLDTTKEMVEEAIEKLQPVSQSVEATQHPTKGAVDNYVVIVEYKEGTDNVKTVVAADSVKITQG